MVESVIIINQLLVTFPRRLPSPILFGNILWKGILRSITRM